MANQRAHMQTRFRAPQEECDRRKKETCAVIMKSDGVGSVAAILHFDLRITLKHYNLWGLSCARATLPVTQFLCDTVSIVSLQTVQCYSSDLRDNSEWKSALKLHRLSSLRALASTSGMFHCSPCTGEAKTTSTGTTYALMSSVRAVP